MKECDYLNPFLEEEFKTLQEQYSGLGKIKKLIRPLKHSEYFLCQYYNYKQLDRIIQHHSVEKFLKQENIYLKVIYISKVVHLYCNRNHLYDALHMLKYVQFKINNKNLRPQLIISYAYRNKALFI